mmetsp:Transcript_62011/g.156555  ORF Transcript_62011/g.156555 Transcript_62011/m.156555 type:complete len:213 (-) Transcript_62011:1228-1866(-)
MRTVGCHHIRSTDARGGELDGHGLGQGHDQELGVLGHGEVCACLLLHWTTWEVWRQVWEPSSHGHCGHFAVFAHLHVAHLWAVCFGHHCMECSTCPFRCHWSDYIWGTGALRVSPRGGVAWRLRCLHGVGICWRCTLLDDWQLCGRGNLEAEARLQCSAALCCRAQHHIDGDHHHHQNSKEDLRRTRRRRGQPRRTQAVATAAAAAAAVPKS